MKRISKLSESPCSKCGKDAECDAKILRNLNLKEIKDGVFGLKGFRYKNCPLYISLTAGELVEID